ncbi:potassium channel subfamily K member 1-like isoform X1 [Episyrphus balteatus]|uniref:potassium channel subfamily K member 1-like isoform X1 n=1 Tax=Episyrphus balteatus TaxID=286459 RepID=UPI002485A5B2|nr:potassium channel subfamily K member 1-like isoform X1 [Episyrphus balteatus]
MSLYIYQTRTMNPESNGKSGVITEYDNNKASSFECNNNNNNNNNNLNNNTIRKTIKTKYQKTKANLKTVGILSERKDRNDYEDLDKVSSPAASASQMVDLNSAKGQFTEHNKNSLKVDSLSGISGDGFDKFEGQTNILGQFENVIHFGEGKSKINLSDSLGPLPPSLSSATTNIQAPPASCTLVIGRDRETLRKENVWFMFFMFLYAMYLVIGSLCFQAIETPVAHNATIDVLRRRTEFLLKYPQIYDDDLEEFLQAVITANDRGISPLRNASNDLNWSFGQALFFSSTVVTTIGYGHVTPLSQTGKIFCMIYATIGIPLTLVLLSAVVERLLIPANWLLGTLNAKLGHLYQPFNIRLLHLSIIGALVAVLFFAIPTTLFSYLEPDWGALDAFYYCFISLTTIGLGDYIPGNGISEENRSLYKICITCYLVFGLIAMMLTLTVFYDIPQLNLGQLFTENINGETEKLRLSGNNTTCYSGPSGLYMPQRDEEVRRAVVRIRPHGDDSPSPDDPPSSMNRDMRIP